jgi:hypothetical protein
MCFDFLYNFVETFLILRRTERDMIKNIFWSSFKVPLFLSDFNEILIFSTSFWQNTQISHFMKHCAEGAGLFHAGGRTDEHDEANSRFSQFCERA